MKKKWIISAGAALMLGALITIAVAEGGDKIREHRQPMARMLRHLDLSGEQKEQLRELRRGHMEAMGEQRKTMAAMRKENRQAVLEVLTEEQLEAVKEMRAEGGEYFGRRGRWGTEGEGMRRGARPFAKLDLTDEQREQFRKLRKEQREEMRATRKQHRSALENLLTDKQREKLEEMKDDAFYRGGKRWRGKP